MSERKRGSGEGSQWWEVPEKKAARRTPSGEDGGGSDAGQQQLPQVVPGRAQEEENAAAQQGSSLDAETRTLDLILAMDRPCASSAEHAGPRTQDLIQSIDRPGTSSANRQADGSDGEGQRSAPLPQGDEALARARLALNAMGPGIFSGNAAGVMPAPIPGGGMPPPLPPPWPRPALSPTERQRVGTAIQAYLSHGNNRQRLLNFAMRGPIRATTSPGRRLCWPSGKASALTGGQRGAASRGITLGHGASSSNLHAPAPALAPGAAGQPVAAAGASGSGARQAQRQANVPAVVNCPYCRKRYPNLACGVCANVVAGLARGALQPHPHRSAGQLPSVSEQHLQHILRAAMANQLGRPVEQPAASRALGSHLPHPLPLPQPQPQPQPQPPSELCPLCCRRQGTFVPPVPERVWPAHFCLCSDCKNKQVALCPTCVVRSWFPRTN